MNKHFDPTAPEEVRGAYVIASNTRWRAIFAVLAVVVPLTLFALFTRQENRLHALAAHGRGTNAVVTGIRNDITYYEYEVEGARHEWNVKRSDAPYPVGQVFPITYLPEDPGLSRPIANYSMSDYQRELGRPFKRAIVFGLFAFFALFSVACHVSLQRMARGTPLRSEPRISPRTAGRVVAALVMLATLGANLDEKVQAVHVRLWGTQPFGVPVTILALVVQFVLFAPLFVLFPNLMTIVMEAQRRGASMSSAGIVTAVATAGPEHRRAKRIVIGIAIYFVVLIAAWIAYAAHRGV